MAKSILFDGRLVLTVKIVGSASHRTPFCFQVSMEAFLVVEVRWDTEPTRPVTMYLKNKKAGRISFSGMHPAFY